MRAALRQNRIRLAFNRSIIQKCEIMQPIALERLQGWCFESIKSSPLPASKRNARPRNLVAVEKARSTETMKG